MSNAQQAQPAATEDNQYAVDLDAPKDGGPQRHAYRRIFAALELAENPTSHFSNRCYFAGKAMAYAEEYEANYCAVEPSLFQRINAVMVSK